MTTTSLRTLLSESLDYAGLFPPAELSLETSIRNYLIYRSHPQSWMLARFVCPVARLTELDTLISKELPGGSIRLTVMGRSDKPPDIPLLGFDGIAAGTEQNKRLRIEGFEARLPSAYAPSDAMALIEAQEKRRPEHSAIAVFLERPCKGMLIREFAQAANQSLANRKSAVRLGWKVRLGGNDPSTIPSPHGLADFVVACREVGNNWKATAGLHQPLGAWDGGRRTFHFGFLSLFAATVLAHVHELGAEQIEEILQETDIGHFRFDDDHFAWRNLSADNQQIAAARKNSLVSFGSCTFEEPIEGLKQLNLLESGTDHE